MTLIGEMTNKTCPCNSKAFLSELSLPFLKTNLEPGEAEDPDHSSWVWGPGCSWWAQWTLFSELRLFYCQYLQLSPAFFVNVGSCSCLQSESSQMETKLSGMLVSSVGKRDCLLGKTPEMKEKSSVKTSKPVSVSLGLKKNFSVLRLILPGPSLSFQCFILISYPNLVSIFCLLQTKLDFGSPKPPRRGVLEEEASIDFVFIPPETKERVLTEHQKEVKRTKRLVCFSALTHS